MSIKTGIPKLDDLIQHGVPDTSFTTFWAKPGLENSPFVYQTIFNNLKANEKVLYVVNNKHPDFVRNDLKNFGWDVSSFEKSKKLLFIDAYSNLVNSPSDERFILSKPKDFNELLAVIKKALDYAGDGRAILVFDNVSTFIDLYGESNLEKLEEYKKYSKSNKLTSLMLFTEWPYNNKTLSFLKDLSDIIVMLKAVEEKVIIRKYYNVVKGGSEKISVPFQIIEPGGVKVYIPKILVTGPYNAGKSSFVKSASIKSFSIDRLGTTIALDHGTVDYAGFRLDLFGTPGQERFDPILKILGAESLGVILVIDASMPETFPRAKDMLSMVKSAGLPFVIAANKSNLKNALSVEEIRRALKFDKNVSIIPIRSKEKILQPLTGKNYCELNVNDVHNVFDALFDRIVNTDA